jgi:hypothetical protein
MTTTAKIEPIPGNPKYRISTEAEVFGPRGPVKPFLVRGGLPAISTSSPKRTIYLAQMTLLIFDRPPKDDEKIEFLDGDPTNWRLENLAYTPAKAWWWQPNKTALEVEYDRIRQLERQLERLMRERAGMSYGYSPGCHGFRAWPR